MGHGSDKMYITHGEHSGQFGDHSGSVGARSTRPTASFARLPFDCCALTLKPFETPVATLDGTIFELLAIIPFLRLHGTDPVTGRKLTTNSLIKLTFFYNNDGKAHDPVTYKVFNEHTHLVAIKTASGANVYSRESIDRLNIKPNAMRDLMSDEPFTKADIITLQDPLNIEQRDLSQFDYVKRELKISDTTEGGSLSGINLGATGVAKLLRSVAGIAEVEVSNPTGTTASVDKAGIFLAKTVAATTAGAKVVPHNISLTSSGRMSSSFTSTALAPLTTTEHALWDEEDLMFEAVQAKAEKGFVRLVTNFGNINLELYCAAAPRTCYNFIQLALANKYKDTIFHRLIPGFMLQGGDPTGTGKGGESCWGGKFGDEFNLRNAHKHEERGTLSMANSGSNTNGSQFFLTFRPTDHLDGKHTVFGRIVGGMEVLDKIERVPVSSTDRPLKAVQIRDVAVFVNPYANYREKLAKKLEKDASDRITAVEKRELKALREQDRTTWLGGNLGASTKGSAREPVKPGFAAVEKKVGVGRYLGGEAVTTGVVGVKRKEGNESGEIGGGAMQKKRKGGNSFGDFGGW